MSWAIGTITLPFAPTRVAVRHEAQVDTSEVSGALPDVIEAYLLARSLTVEGEIYGLGSTTANLESAYVTALNGYMGTTCAVAFPDTRYDGTYLMSGITWEEIHGEGGMAKLNYSMEFLLGTEYVIL